MNGSADDIAIVKIWDANSTLKLHHTFILYASNNSQYSPESLETCLQLWHQRNLRHFAQFCANSIELSKVGSCSKMQKFRRPYWTCTTTNFNWEGLKWKIFNNSSISPSKRVIKLIFLCAINHFVSDPSIEEVSLNWGIIPQLRDTSSIEGSLTKWLISSRKIKFVMFLDGDIEELLLLLLLLLLLFLLLLLLLLLNYYILQPHCMS